MVGQNKLVSLLNHDSLSLETIIISSTLCIKSENSFFFIFFFLFQETRVARAILNSIYIIVWTATKSVWFKKSQSLPMFARKILKLYISKLHFLIQKKKKNIAGHVPKKTGNISLARSYSKRPNQKFNSWRL